MPGSVGGCRFICIPMRPAGTEKWTEEQLQSCVTRDSMVSMPYRGITAVVILAKLHAMVVEARTSAWAEQMKFRAKGQAGFRKDIQTADKIFVIQTLVQQAKQAKQKLYCCFFSERLLTWSPATLCGALCNIKEWVARF